MQRLEVSGAVRPIYGSLGVKRLNVSDYMAYVLKNEIFLLKILFVWDGYAA
jgi:hypothetical protein